MKIVEYMPKYKEQIIDLLIDVAVNEFGFKEWEKWFKIFRNENYIKEGGNCWIALNNQDNVIGTISLKNRNNGVGEIKNLYVAKEERNKKIASSLFAVLLQFAKSNDYTKLRLDTYKEFENAIYFYEKRGFYMNKKEENRFIYELNLNEKISIIIPVYNVENHIEHCLESVIKQTYKNLQIILVDDGSTDKSGEICDKYSSIDKRIEVIHKPNGGLADARNTGIDRANGVYLGFLDSDDYIYPTFYEELYKIVKEYNADIGECEFLRISIEEKEKSQEIIEKSLQSYDEQEVTTNIEALRLLYGPRLKPYLKKVVVWNKLYKKELFEKIRFPLGKLHEDEYTTYKILYTAQKIVSTNKILHGYMQTKNSIMRQEIKQKRIDDNLDAYIKSSEFFKELKETEIEMKSRRRYLENCIELAGKVIRGDGKNKERQVEQISHLYKEHYKTYIEKIKEAKNDEREDEIIQILDKAYKDNTLDEKYWIDLEQIINKGD